MTHRIALALPFVLVLACSPTSPSTGSAPSASASASSPSPGPAPTPALPGPTSGRIKGMIVAADSCTGIGKALQASSALVPNGTRLTQRFATGCGCLKGAAHYTVAYEPRTSPLRVHLCDGPGVDTCEMACSGTLEWEMAAALKEAGASGFKLVD